MCAGERHQYSPFFSLEVALSFLTSILSSFPWGWGSKEGQISSSSFERDAGDERVHKKWFFYFAFLICGKTKKHSFSTEVVGADFSSSTCKFGKVEQFVTRNRRFLFFSSTPPPRKSQTFLLPFTTPGEKNEQKNPLTPHYWFSQKKTFCAKFQKSFEQNENELWTLIFSRIQIISLSLGTYGGSGEGAMTRNPSNSLLPPFQTGWARETFLWVFKFFAPPPPYFHPPCIWEMGGTRRRL